MWHFRHAERPFSYERFKRQLSFNPSYKYALIETYLSSLEKRFHIRSKRFDSPTKGGLKSL